MTLSALILAAIAVLPADRLAMADRLFNRGEYAAAKEEYAALRGEKAVPADELLYRLAECDRALGKGIRRTDREVSDFRARRPLAADARARRNARRAHFRTKGA